jgi:hypothetical protein
VLSGGLFPQGEPGSVTLFSAVTNVLRLFAAKTRRTRT